MSFPTTLPEIVAAVDHASAHLSELDVAIRSHLDQLAARSAEELKVSGIDLGDPDTARVVAVTAFYILNRGRTRAQAAIPGSFLEYVDTLAGAYDAINGITSAVAQRHREKAATS